MLEFSALWHPYLPSQNISEGKPNQPTNKGPAISSFFRSVEVSHLYVLTVVYVFLLLDSLQGDPCISHYSANSVGTAEHRQLQESQMICLEAV